MLAIPHCRRLNPRRPRCLPPALFKPGPHQDSTSTRRRPTPLNAQSLLTMRRSARRGDTPQVRTTRMPFLGRCKKTPVNCACPLFPPTPTSINPPSPPLPHTHSPQKQKPPRKTVLPGGRRPALPHRHQLPMPPPQAAAAAVAAAAPRVNEHQLRQHKKKHHQRPPHPHSPQEAAAARPAPAGSAIATWTSLAGTASRPDSPCWE